MVSIIMTVLFSCFIVAVVLRTAYRMFVKKQYPDHSYTPFDYVSGQTETHLFMKKKGKRKKRMTEQDSVMTNACPVYLVPVLLR